MATSVKINGRLALQILLAAVFCVGPAGLDFSSSGISFVFDSAIAKEGGGGSGGGGSGGSGGGGGSGSGSSGSGGNSGSGNSGSGNSGSGNSGSGNSGSGSNSSGKNANGANAKAKEGQENRGGTQAKSLVDLYNASRFRGAVTKIRKKRSLIEITYRDGWKERLFAGRYFLLDPKNRLVVKRAAKKLDFTRINGARKTTGR